MKKSYVNNVIKSLKVSQINKEDMEFLIQDCKWSGDKILEMLKEKGIAVL